MKVIHLEQKDPRLGRHVVHDPASRGFAYPAAVDRSTWVSKTIRIFDPSPNPNQSIGNCTMCAKAMQLNAAGNRVSGVTLNMDWAVKGYEWETAHDNFPGTYPPDDTGSSGLWSAKTAQHLGVGGAYTWLFGGADQVVQAVMAGDVVSVGTRWDQQMFHPDAAGIVHPGGTVAGGHQWAVHGYDHKRDLVRGRCWWGSFRDFWIARGDLAALLADNGDAHIQQRSHG